MAIEGFAGNGKTTLALEMAYRVLSPAGDEPPARFAYAVWISAKHQPERRLWHDEVLNMVAQLLGAPTLTQLPLPEKEREVNALLHTWPVLLVIDNFETITDPALVGWLHRLPEPSKVLITSRHAQLRTAWAIHLGGLDAEAALTLIRQHGRRLHSAALADAADADLRPLIEVTGRNPRAIELALGHLKYRSLTEIVAHLYAASPDMAEIFNYLFAFTWDRLGADARRLLCATPLFAAGMDRSALGAVADLTGIRLDLALGELLDGSLLEVQDDAMLGPPRYTVHPLTRAFAAAQLGAEPGWAAVAYDRWLAWYKEFLVTFGTEHDLQDWPAFLRLDEERANLLAALDWALLHQPATAILMLQQL